MDGYRYAPFLAAFDADFRESAQVVLAHPPHCFPAF
jgi:hypothetical protein